MGLWWALLRANLPLGHVIKKPPFQTNKERGFLGPLEVKPKSHHIKRRKLQDPNKRVRRIENPVLSSINKTKPSSILYTGRGLLCVIKDWGYLLFMFYYPLGKLRYHAE